MSNYQNQIIDFVTSKLKPPTKNCLFLFIKDLLLSGQENEQRNRKEDHDM